MASNGKQLKKQKNGKLNIVHLCCYINNHYAF